jgi:LPS-assembly lipoprotein
MRLHLKSILIFMLLPTLLAACGFHLRGEQDLSAVLPEVKIQGVDKYSDLGRELYQSLLSSKVNITDDSNIVLDVSNENLSKRVLSVDSAGRANQYELNYQLSFKLVKLVQEEQGIRQLELLPQQTISTKREYLFDSNLVLAKADEEIQLKKDMRQSLMLQLVRRLNYSLKTEKNEAVKAVTK